MKQRRVAGSEVSAVGLGCMGMSEFYGEADESASIATLHGALDLGVTFFDTAEIYGNGRNEALLGKAFAGRWNEIFVATKFGIMRDSEGQFLGLDSSPENVRRACEGSLSRLGTERIDLYYQHRVDPETPIEDTVGALSRLVEEGKIAAVGLSEASADTIRRAAAVHPVAAVQTEYSIFSRDVESEVVPVCRDLGITLVPYSPLGRGMLTGKLKDIAALADDDYRRMQPRFQGESLAANLALVEELEAVAAAKSVTPGQVALAWLLEQGKDIIPIPGTTRLAHLEENIGALEVTLDADETRRLNDLADRVAGQRYDEGGMASIDG